MIEISWPWAAYFCVGALMCVSAVKHNGVPVWQAILLIFAWPLFVAMAAVMPVGMFKKVQHKKKEKDDE